MWVYCLYDFDVCEDGSLKKLYIYFLGKFDDVCVFEVVCCDFCFFIFFILNVKSWKVVCWYFIYLDLFIKYQYFVDDVIFFFFIFFYFFLFDDEQVCWILDFIFFIGCLCVFDFILWVLDNGCYFVLCRGFVIWL